MTHNVLVYKKIKSTNHLYPRQWNQIIKDK
jgi:hypothetical protein